MDASNEDNAVISSKELASKSSSWTLGCDNLLLNKLKNFSKELQENSKQLQQECKELGKDAATLQAKLHNVTNEFLLLSNTQFVENRVDEFQEESAPSSSQLHSQLAKQTKTEKEAELIAKMKTAIQLGVSCTEESILNQDASFEITLPYVIGSPKYFSSRYAGLVDENQSARGAELINNTEDEDTLISLINNQSNNQNYDRMENSNYYYIPNTVPITPQVHSPSLPSNPINEQNTHSQPIYQSVINQPPSTSILPPEVPKYYANINKQQNSYYSNDEGPPPVTVDSDEMSEDDFTPLVGPGGGRLFADDDEDDHDIFKDSSLFPSAKPHDLFFNSSQPIFENTIRSSPPPLPIKNDILKGQSAFLGNEPIKNENYSTKSNNQPNFKSQQVVSPSATESEAESHERKPKIPPGGVSIFGSVPPSQINKLRKQQEPRSVSEEPEAQSISKCVNVSERGSSVGTNEDETTSHSSHTSRGLTSSQGSLNEPAVSAQITTTTKRPKIVKPKSVFNEDSDDDLFSSSSSQKNKKPSLLPESKKNSSGLFGDPITTTFPVPSSRSISALSNASSSKNNFRRSIFDDDSDSDDGLFSSASSTSSRANQPKILVLPAQSGLEKKKKSGGLFADDSESDSDLFSDKNILIKSSTSDKNTRKEANLDNKIIDKSPKAEVKQPTAHNVIKMQSEELDKNPEIDKDKSQDKEQLQNEPSLNVENKFQEDQENKIIEPSSLIQPVETGILEQVKSEIDASVTNSEPAEVENLEKKLDEKEDSSDSSSTAKIKETKVSTEITNQDTIEDMNLRLFPEDEQIEEQRNEDHVDRLIVPTTNQSFDDSPSENSPVQLLSHLAKGRPKINTKRRLPSKQLLHSYKIPSSVDDIDFPKDIKDDNHNQKITSRETTPPDDFLKKTKEADAPSLFSQSVEQTTPVPKADDEDDGDIFKNSSLLPSTKTRKASLTSRSLIHKGSPSPEKEVIKASDQASKSTESTSEIIKPKIPRGGVSMFGGMNPISADVLKQSQLKSKTKTPIAKSASDETTNKPTIKSKQTAAGNADKATSSNSENSKPKPKPVKSKSEESKIVTEISNTDLKLKNPTIENASSSGSSEKKHLSQNSETTAEKQNNAQTSRIKPKSIFDDNSDDDLFSSSSSTKKSSIAELEKQTPSNSISKSPSESEVNKSEKTGKSSVFDDSDSEDNLFSSKSNKSKLSKSKKAKTKIADNKNKTKGLFDSDDGSDSDLFKTRRKAEN